MPTFSGGKGEADFLAGGDRFRLTLQKSSLVFTGNPLKDMWQAIQKSDFAIVTSEEPTPGDIGIVDIRVSMQHGAVNTVGQMSNAVQDMSRGWLYKNVSLQKVEFLSPGELAQKIGATGRGTSIAKAKTEGQKVADETNPFNRIFKVVKTAAIVAVVVVAGVAAIYVAGLLPKKPK